MKKVSSYEIESRRTHLKALQDCQLCDCDDEDETNDDDEFNTDL